MDVVFLKCDGEWICNGSMLLQRPRGPMDKASAYGAGDCRFESCRGHSCKLMWHARADLLRAAYLKASCGIGSVLVARSSAEGGGLKHILVAGSEG